MNTQQIRAIRHYAHAMHLPLEQAAWLWIEHGLAEQWRNYYG